MQILKRNAAAPPSVPVSDPWAALRPLADPNYLVFWLSSLPWNLGRWIEMLVSGWLMLELTNSAWAVALLGFFRAAALPALGVFAGVVADRVDRLNLVRTTQALNIGVPACLTTLVLTDAIAPWHLYLGTLLFGLSWAFDFPTRRALMSDLLPESKLVQGTVLDNLSMNTSKIIGPALGGVILALYGPAAGYGSLCLAYLTGCALLLRVRRPALSAERVTGSPLRNLLDGLAYVVRDRAILAVLVITIIMNCLVFPHQQLLSVFARDIFHVGPVELGWLTAANGIGALAGLVLISRLRGGGPHGWVFAIGSSVVAATLLAFALTGWFGLGLTLLILGGVGHAGFGTMQSAIILGQARPEMRGRALGALTLAIGASPFGALVMGALAEQHGAPFAVAVCAASALVTIALTLLLLPALRHSGVTHPP
jgi:MFS family permease